MTPEDRRRHGIVPWQSGESNLTMSDLDRLSAKGVVRRGERAEAARSVAAEIGLPAEMLARPATTLSGGNQQKLVVGRWVQRPPAVLLLDEPTIGVDIGAKAEMLGFVRKLSDRGISTIVVSAEWEELIDTCDRILVLARGRLVGELQRGEATEDRILRMVFAVMEEA
jgi:ABC-type sugar transport system ATPase subunit